MSEHEQEPKPLTLEDLGKIAELCEFATAETETYFIQNNSAASMSDEQRQRVRVVDLPQRFLTALAAKDKRIEELERTIRAYASDKREREDELASLREEAKDHREDIARLHDLIRGWRGRALGAEGRLEALREAEGGSDA